MQNQQNSLVFEQITNHRHARIAESSRPQQSARPIIISVTSGTSDRCSLARPAASRLCASWKSTAIFRANSSEAAKACHKGLRPPCANPALKSTNASINSARCFVGTTDHAEIERINREIIDLYGERIRLHRNEES